MVPIGVLLHCIVSVLHCIPVLLLLLRTDEPVYLNGVSPILVIGNCIELGISPIFGTGNCIELEISLIFMTGNCSELEISFIFVISNCIESDLPNYRTLTHLPVERAA